MSTEEQECPHGLDPAWCSICLHPSSKADTQRFGAVFRAHYEGQCCECNLPIYRGQMVRVLSGPITNRFAHTSCAQGGHDE